MKKPTETRKWTQDDIKDVSQELPEFANFGSLSSSNKSSLTIDIGLGIKWKNMDEKVQSVKDSLENAGVDVDEIIITSGYSGTKSSHVLLECKMK